MKNTLSRKRYLTRLLFVLSAAVMAVLGLYIIRETSLLRPGSIEEMNKSRFKKIIVDRNGPFSPWGKAVGDVNGDGLVDLIVGGHDGRPLYLYERILRKLRIINHEKADGAPELVMYESPKWKKRVIARGRRFGTDIEIVDIDGDGENDVVSIAEEGLLWFKNPDWTATLLDTKELHDIEVGDFDEDGNIDIVARNQSAFSGRGDRLYFYYQQSGGAWKEFNVSCPDGEGLKVADINGDKRLDVVVNNIWFENSGKPESRGWLERRYSRSWEWPHTSISVGDVNGDGHPDIILTPSEKEGMSYRISWFESSELNHNEWREHIIEDNVECVYHCAGTADMNNDGAVDIITARMHQGGDPDEVMIYVNKGGGLKWSKEVLSNKGSHNMRLVDIDGDGDMDLFGANWSGEYQAIELWVNQICRWQRHVIDGKKPWRSVFITSADIDSDGRKDVVTGGWWYKNPGNLSRKWKRRNIGKDANNMAAAFDIDGDGDFDLLATDGKVGGNAFVWARNNGAGKFEILKGIPRGRGDFLQGIAVGEFSPGEKSVVVSWHSPNKGIQKLVIPGSPDSQPWTWHEVSEISQDEELNAGDINGDGVLDLLLGTKWFRNDGDSWTDFNISFTESNPDRNRLVDLNRDGRLDAVVGFEAISKPGKVAWYEQGSVATEPWTEHVIGTCIGPMSLDVADMDGDGDLDVTVGEHNLDRPEEASMLIFNNTAGNGAIWEKELVYVGDEHHDGAHTVDIDGDGDNDIVSIGWGHRKVVLYENKNEKCSIKARSLQDE